MSSKTIAECMTTHPVSIPADASLADACERMHEHDIRHLPVIDRGRVVGLVSERDLAVVSGIPGIDKQRVEVTEAMVANPYVVAPETPLEEVVAVMHEHKLGTAVVMAEGEVRGIFSVVDALAVLLLMLREA
ncbi:MAG: CBS domain-containing protein [Enhygromyxa sp.]